MRSREELEYELLDTGVFDDDRYFDVFVEYAKAGPEDILDPDHRSQPRTGAGAAAPAADALVPEHVVLGRGRRRSLLCERPGPASSKPHITNSASTRCHVMEHQSCCSLRTKATSSSCGVSPTRPRM